MKKRPDFQWWRDALAGKRGDLIVGECECGFYADKDRIPVAVRRLDDGSLQARVGDRSNFKDVSADASHAETRFSFYCMKPVSYEDYLAAYDGKGWPWEVPTPAVDESSAENPRAVLGGNNPPEELTPDQQIARDVSALEAQVKKWLEEIGGKPKTKVQADLVANYREKFLAFENEAEAKRKDEKKPHWDAGLAVDAKWAPIVTGAKTLKQQLWDIGQAYIKAENFRLAEEARLENERLAEAARLAKALNPEAPPPEVAPVVAQTVTIGTIRQVSEKKQPGIGVEVADNAAFAVFLAAEDDPDLKACLLKVARAKVKANVAHLPGVTVDGKPRIHATAA